MPNFGLSNSSNHPLHHPHPKKKRHLRKIILQNPVKYSLFQHFLITRSERIYKDTLVKQKLSPLVSNVLRKKSKKSYFTYVKDVHMARHEQQHGMCVCPRKEMLVLA